MHLIIVGAGNVGSPLIEIATQGGNEVVVERDKERAEAAADFDSLSFGDAAARLTLSSPTSLNRTTTADGPKRGSSA